MSSTMLTTIKNEKMRIRICLSKWLLINSKVHTICPIKGKVYLNIPTKMKVIKKFLKNKRKKYRENKSS